MKSAMELLSEMLRAVNPRDRAVSTKCTLSLFYICNTVLLLLRLK